MIPLELAQAEVLAACAPRAPRTFDLDRALGLVLAEKVVATEAVPPFDNSAMDGYAVRAADIARATAEQPARLRVVGTIAAGARPPRAIRAGEAARIMTGAVFPEGADTVAVVESTERDGDDVLVEAPSNAGQHVRHAGDDLLPGQEVFASGVVLGPAHLGVLSSVGVEKVSAVPLPVVGVLSTGDELVEGAAPLQPGQIRDSNRRTVLSLLRRDGFGAVDLGIARDDEAVIEASLRDGAASCDAIITSGGVSMGDFDYVKAVLGRIARVRWMQVAIRPAKPFAFGLLSDTPVFGLPGNPVSSMVSYEVLARPALRRMAGRQESDLRRPMVRAVVEGEPLTGARDGRTSFVRVRAAVGPQGRLHISSSGGQASHQLHAMAVANALAVVDPGGIVNAGDEVSVMLLSL